MLAGLDGHEHRHTGVDLNRIEDRDPALDHTGLFQLLHAAPAGRRRKADFLADVSDRPGAILLQNAEDLDIHVIEHGALLGGKLLLLSVTFKGTVF